MDLHLSGKTALVLGASSGLGWAMAEALAREGVKVALTGRRAVVLESRIGVIHAIGGTAISLVWDLADLAAIESNVARVEAELGPIDILVNNTGGPPPTTAAGQPVELWSKQFQAMVLSVIATTDRVLPGMKERKFGRIITSASSGVIAPIPNLGLSNALRSTLMGWSKTLAREVAAHGITVNMVVPGRIATDRIGILDRAKADREGKSVEQVQAESLATIPAGRYGKPEEYADLVAFLASPRAAYITGSTLRVDGGLIPNV
ncbi:FabG Dehydrogenases with different specificities (related to short-chain alcohol dehydrogenases) [Rhabdaerophilaceae bacterium]